MKSTYPTGLCKAFFFMVFSLLYVATSQADDRGLKGVTFQQVGHETAQMQNLPRFDHAQVINIDDDSPAASAGLRSGDVIISIDEEVVSQQRFLDRIAEKSSGETVSLEISRDGLRGEVLVTLDRERSQSAPEQSTAETTSQPERPFTADTEEEPVISMLLYLYTEDGPFGDLDDGDSSTVLAGLGYEFSGFAPPQSGRNYGLTMGGGIVFPVLSMIDDDRVELSEVAFRVGGHFSLSPDITFYGMAGPLYASARSDFGSDNDLSLSPEIGAVFNLSDTYHAKLDLAYRMDSMNDIIDEDSIRVGLRIRGLFLGFHSFLDSDTDRDFRFMFGLGF